MIHVNLQWVFDHWDQITVSVTLIVYLISTIAVGMKEHPLEREDRLHFLWRVAGVVAFVTFKNLYGTWKLPMSVQPVDPWPGIAPVQTTEKNQCEGQESPKALLG